MLAHRLSGKPRHCASGCFAVAAGPGPRALATTSGSTDRFGALIAADARLDDRAALARTLNLREVEPDVVLIAAAYRRWGSECVAHLLGDFAFAAWEPERQKLFCARDHFGVKPFYYAASDERFAFASEARSLLVLPDVDGAIHRRAVADFLGQVWLDPEQTFFEGVLRLPAGCSLTATAEGVAVARYYSPVSRPAGDVGDAPATFRHLFAQAVADRLQGEERVGAFLSGGLDSSSVCAVAAPLHAAQRGKPLIAVSMLFRREEFSEQPFIDEVLTRGDMTPLPVWCDEVLPFDGLDRLVECQGEPPAAPNLKSSDERYRQAAAAGLTAILDGHGGDEVVGFGLGRLVELAMAGRWLALWKECKGVAAGYSGSRALLFRRALPANQKIARLRALLRRLPIRPVGRGNDSAAMPPTILAPQLDAEFDMATRRYAQATVAVGSRASDHARHLAALSGAQQAMAFEVLDRITAAHGIEGRYPFWDKRLVEFSLSLPPIARLESGWTRMILRQAMKGILPERIRWRRDKHDFSSFLADGLVQSRVRFEDLVSDPSGDLDDLVDLPSVRAMWDRCRDPLQADGMDLQGIWHAAVLASWLRQRPGWLGSGRRAESGAGVA